MIHFPHHFPRYFKSKLNPQLRELFFTAALMDFASAAITLFEPIYLWTLGYRLPEIMVFYLLVYGSYFFLVPLGGKFVARFGPERSIMISTVWLVGYFAALIAIGTNSAMLYVAPVLFALQKTFYWPAYHFDFMRYSQKAERASEFSGLWAVTMLMYVLGPVIGGVVVKLYGFQPLFIGAAVIILLSSSPMFQHPGAVKKEAFSYWRSLVLPFRRRYWKNTAGYLGLGEELLGMTVWPIFTLLIYGDIFEVGALVGASALITSVVTLAAGKFTDRHNKKKILSLSGLLQVGAWLARLFTRHPAGVFAIDVAGRSIHNSVFVSLSALTYDRAHEDDYSWHGVYYEQGFALAKTLMAIVVMMLATSADPFNLVFILGALTSFLYLIF